VQPSTAPAADEPKAAKSRKSAPTQKYEFVEGDTKIVAPGIVAKRIRALVTIPALLWAPAVQPGDLGGYIVEQKNLHAQVSGNAWVYGDAQVSGNAQVYGNALICWFSKVGSENGTLTIYNTKANSIEVTRGCFRGTVDEFLAASARKHDARIQHEYKLLIEVGVSRITAAREEQAE